MAGPSRVVPEDPIGFIRDRVHAGQVLWTYHVMMRVRGRSISRESILGLSASYSLVESYPDDKYLPSYLVLAQEGDEAFHVLFAADVLGQNVRVVTAYRPSLDEWESDLRTRRRTP